MSKLPTDTWENSSSNFSSNENTKLQAQLIARLMVLEAKLNANDKVSEKIIESFKDIDKKIDEIRREIGHLKNFPEVVKQVDILEEKINNIKLDLAETSWIKKLLSGVVGLILISVITIILNSSITTNNHTDEKIEKLIEKLNNEYKK